MPISYVLFENNLTSDPDGLHGGGAAHRRRRAGRHYRAHHPARLHGGQGRHAVGVSVLEDYHTAIENMVLEGVNVNTPLANYGVSIKGVFNGPADGFDPSRHQVVGTVSPGKRYRRAVKERAQAAKVEALKPKPNPIDAERTDVNSGTTNGMLTPNGMGQLVGHRLKFDPADAAQGIFFIAEDGSETRVDTVGRNKPAELMFQAPALAAGDYALEVRAKVYGGENVRAGALEATLTVA